MYRLVPLVSACTTIFPILPVEVWCLILRALDGKSLLATVRSASYFGNIVRGDPVLRKTLRDAVKDAKREMSEWLNRPGMALTITREGSDRLFGSNCRKKVTTAKCPDMQDYPRIEKTTRNHRKMKVGTTKSNRYAPYRI